MSLTHFQHTTPPFRTFCGDGALSWLSRELDRLGCERTVLVTGHWLDTHQAVAKRVTDAVGARLVGVFDEVVEHSPIPSVQGASLLLADVGADSVIALGGGSSIVTARVASILLAEGRQVRELCTHRDADGRLISPKLQAPKIPNWIIPTTPTTAYAKAGSAVRDPESGERLALFDPKTRAQGILVDPEVVLTSPLSLASSAALNAFSMAVESILAGVDDPLADALLFHALRELSIWLPKLIASPRDPEPRMRLMLCSLMCGQGSDYVGGGLAQALSHAAGPRSTVSNGVVEAVLLPHAMRFTAETSPGRLNVVADALGIDGNHPKKGPAIEAVTARLEALSVPSRLRDVGVAAESLDEIVEHALEDWSLTRVPRRPTREQLMKLLKDAW